VKSVIPW